MLTGAKKQYQTPEQMQEVIDAYYKERENKCLPLTIESLCAALDMDRSTLLTYGRNESHKDFHNTVKKAKTKVLENFTDNALTGNTNPALTIFLLKNNFHYVDKVENEISGNQEKPLNLSVNINTIPSYRTELPSSEEDVILRK